MFKNLKHFFFNFFEFDKNLEISTENLPKNPYLQEHLSSDTTTCQEQICTLVYFLSLNRATLFLLTAKLHS